MNNYEKSLTQYKKAVALVHNLKLKGKTMPYTSMNGHMFSLLGKDGTLGIRLSKVEKEEFESEYKTKEFKQYGAVMRGYVTIPETLLEKPKEVAKILKQSISYIKTLEPK